MSEEASVTSDHTWHYIPSLCATLGMLPLSFGSMIRNTWKLSRDSQTLLVTIATSVCAVSRWQTCKAGAVLSLGRTGFMTAALSLLCTVLLLQARSLPWGPPLGQLFCLKCCRRSHEQKRMLLSSFAYAWANKGHVARTAVLSAYSRRNYSAPLAPGWHDINLLDL